MTHNTLSVLEIGLAMSDYNKHNVKYALERKYMFGTSGNMNFSKTMDITNVDFLMLKVAYKTSTCIASL